MDYHSVAPPSSALARASCSRLVHTGRHVQPDHSGWGPGNWGPLLYRTSAPCWHRAATRWFAPLAAFQHPCSTAACGNTLASTFEPAFCVTWSRLLTREISQSGAVANPRVSSAQETACQAANLTNHARHCQRARPRRRMMALASYSVIDSGFCACEAMQAALSTANSVETHDVGRMQSSSTSRRPLAHCHLSLAHCSEST